MIPKDSPNPSQGCRVHLILGRRLGAAMNTQKPTALELEFYEMQKAMIVALNLPHKEYEKRIKALAKKLGV